MLNSLDGHQCYECGEGKIHAVDGVIIIKSIKYGAFSVPDIHYEKCDNCGNILLDLEACLKIEKFMERFADWRFKNKRG